jgi:hypothetical protein
MLKFLCWLGIHKWMTFQESFKRICIRCHKVQEWCLIYVWKDKTTKEKGK